MYDGGVTDMVTKIVVYFLEIIEVDDNE